jgi:ribosomal-protein-alanine N-acetyltransferase
VVAELAELLPAPSACVELEEPSEHRMQEFLLASERSEALHRGWVVPPRTPQEYLEYLRRIRRATHVGYFVCTPAGELAGVINLNDIVRAAFQSAFIGYFALVPHQRRGLMAEALRQVLEHAFGEHGLHRLEANIQSHNSNSLRLARRLGFRAENLAPRYLKIGGEWRDHERWALTREQWFAASSGAPSLRRGL